MNTVESTALRSATVEEKHNSMLLQNTALRSATTEEDAYELDDQQALVVVNTPFKDISIPLPHEKYIPSVDQMIAAWLHAKFQRSMSEKTLHRYKRHITDFRKVFHQKTGLDLDANPSLIATLALGDRVLWRVVISVGGRIYTANAEAKLNAAKNTPDGTKPFECAETSAIGRALAFAGFGPVERIAAYDEVMRSREGRLVS